MGDPEVTIRLTPAEAVVLDELLRRYSISDRLSVEHDAERQALWNLLCLMERQVDRPLWPSIAEARAALSSAEAEDA